MPIKLTWYLGVFLAKFVCFCLVNLWCSNGSIHQHQACTFANAALHTFFFKPLGHEVASVQEALLSYFLNYIWWLFGLIQKSPYGDFTELFFNKSRFIIAYFEMLDSNILCPMVWCSNKSVIGLNRVWMKPDHWTSRSAALAWALTSGRHPPWVSSHCKQARLPVAAASWAGLAPLFATQLPGSPASSTRNRRQDNFPARAAWCAGVAPSASLTSPVRDLAAKCSLRIWRSPWRAASSVLSTSSTMMAAEGAAGWKKPSFWLCQMSPTTSPNGRCQHCVQKKLQVGPGPLRFLSTFPKCQADNIKDRICLSININVTLYMQK